MVSYISDTCDSSVSRLPYRKVGVRYLVDPYIENINVDEIDIDEQEIDIDDECYVDTKLPYYLRNGYVDFINDD
jgi:hypothetical protein